MFACEIRFIEISNRYARIEADPLHEYLFLFTDFIEFIFRNHHHVSLRYFGHLRLTRQQDEITPLYGGITPIKKPPDWRLVVVQFPVLLSYLNCMP